MLTWLVSARLRTFFLGLAAAVFLMSWALVGSVHLSGARLIALVVLLAVWLTLCDRLLFRPLAIVREKAVEISSNPTLIGEEVPLPHGRELADLTAAFNRMSVLLARERSERVEGFQKTPDEIEDVRALLRLIIDSSQDIIFVKGTDLRYLACNNKFLNVVGRSEEEILGHADSDWLVQSEAMQSLGKGDLKVLEEAVVVRVEGAVTHPDGRVVCYEIVKSPYLSETGKLLGVIGVARDMSERTQAVEALRRTEEKFANAFRVSPTAMSLTTQREGKFTDVNRAFELLCGCTRAELLGKTFVELGFVSSEERARLRNIVEVHGRVRDEEIVFRRESGEPLLLKVSVEPVDIGGEPCLLVIVEDITQKKRMEQALRESEKLFSEIFHLSPEIAVITRESDGTVIAVNDAFLQTCGFRREEVMGKSTLELGVWGSLADRLVLLERYRRDGKIQNAETVLHKKSGEPFPVMYSLIPVDIRGSPAFLRWEPMSPNARRPKRSGKVSRGFFARAKRLKQSGHWRGALPMTSTTFWRQSSGTLNSPWSRPSMGKPERVTWTRF